MNKRKMKPLPEPTPRFVDIEAARVANLEDELRQAHKWLTGAELPIKGYVSQWARRVDDLLRDC